MLRLNPSCIQPSTGASRAVWCRSGFTLIELLAVAAIIVLLSGLLLPLVGQARRQAAKTNTMSLMRKVETGLELFKGEVEAYPYQAHDPNENFPEAANRLAWVLGHKLNETERADLNADLVAVRLAYAPGGAHRIEHAYKDNHPVWPIAGDVDPKAGGGGISFDYVIHSVLASRAACERANLAILAGNVTVKGVRPKLGVQLLPLPRSQGMAFDFLSYDLNPSDVVGDALVDFWGRPLVYNCPVVQGVLPFYANESHLGGHQSEAPVDPHYYGMATTGRDVTTSRASDQRTTAAAPYIHRYELWSIGPDGMIDPQRDASVNRDNVSPTDYWQGLE